jgi:hypothetical protein
MFCSLNLKGKNVFVFLLIFIVSINLIGADEDHFFKLGDDSIRFLFSGIPGWHWASEVWTSTVSEDVIKTAKENGITGFHLMLPPIEKELGEFRETEFQRLDVFLDLCSNYGVYVMISFLQAYAIAVDPEDPYYHPHGIDGLIRNNALKEAFKERVKNIVNRTNTVNGKPYRHDPTIMAWIIVEEPISAPWNYPEGPPEVSIPELQNWFTEMANFIRSFDPYHLLTVNTTAAVDYFGYCWPEMFNLPALDFYYVEDADARILDLFPIGGADDYPLRLMNFGKPMIVMLSFSSGIWDQDEISGDFIRQAEILDNVTNKYLAEGFSGVGYCHWGSVLYYGLYEPYMPPNTNPYQYNATIAPICNMIRKQAENIGSLNWPLPPLKFVTITPLWFDLSINVTPGGTTYPPPGIISYYVGTEISVSAVPEDTYVFDHWSGDIGSASNPLEISMFSAQSITACFRLIHAPFNFTGEKKLNRSLSQAEYINILDWSENPLNSGLGIQHYRLYQLQNVSTAIIKQGSRKAQFSRMADIELYGENKTLIVELPSSSFQYQHRGVEKDGIYYYAIVAVTGDGREGETAHISIGY